VVTFNIAAPKFSICLLEIKSTYLTRQCSVFAQPSILQFPDQTNISFSHLMQTINHPSFRERLLLHDFITQSRFRWIICRFRNYLCQLRQENFVSGKLLPHITLGSSPMGQSLPMVFWINRQEILKLEMHSTCGTKVLVSDSRRVNWQFAQYATKSNYLGMAHVDPSPHPKVEVQGQDQFVAFPRWTVDHNFFTKLSSYKPLHTPLKWGVRVRGQIIQRQHRRRTPQMPGPSTGGLHYRSVRTMRPSTGH